MKCIQCKIREATIHLENTGGLCLKCHNELMEHLLGVDQMDDFSNMIAVLDADEILHRFEISNMLLPGFSVWRAEEISGNYKFEVLTTPHGNQAVAIEQLHHKILKGLGYKTLKLISDKHIMRNAINMNNEQYGLNTVGTCRIEYTEEDSVSLIIDGMEIPFDAFGEALTSFEGFNMEFQIRSSTDDVLGKEMLLKAVKVNAKVLIDRFEQTLGWFLENDFLSYKRESLF